MQDHIPQDKKQERAADDKTYSLVAFASNGRNGEDKKMQDKSSLKTIPCLFVQPLLFGCSSTVWGMV